MQSLSDILYLLRLKRLFLFSLCIALCGSLAAQSLSVKDSLQLALSATDADTNRMRLLNDLAVTYWRIDHDSSVNYASEALKLGTAHNHQRGVGRARINLGVIHYLKGEYANALGEYVQAVTAFEQIGYLRGVANAQNNIGVVYRLQGDFANAIEHYYASLEVRQQINDTEGVGKSYNNLGVVYEAQGKYEQALSYYKKSLGVKQELGDSAAIATARSNIGTVQIDLGQFNLGLQSYQHALRYAEASGDQFMQATVLQNIGLAQLELKEHAKALEAAYAALQLRNSIVDHSGIATTCNLLGGVYHELNASDSAVHYYSMALHKAQELGAQATEYHASAGLSRAYQQQQNFERALHFVQHAGALEDSLNSEASTRKITQLEMRYSFDQELRELSAIQREQDLIAEAELEQQKLITYGFVGGFALMLAVAGLILLLYRNKQQANRALGEQKEAIRKQADALEVQNSEKEVLLREIHHRVKNNLQIISSLLNIQSRKVQDASAQEALKEGRARVKSMALIHQKLYSKTDLANIPFSEYITDLCRSLMQTYGDPERIQSKLDLEDIALDVDTSIPLGLILNELITNALKYAFPDQATGTISISLQRLNEGICLTVADDGIGLPEGFESGKNGSFGLQLVRSFASKLNGELSFISDAGTRVSLTFEPKSVVSTVHE